MKKTEKITLIVLIALSVVISLGSCRERRAEMNPYKLVGVYEGQVAFGTKTVYEFSDSEVKRTVSGELGEKTVVGEYEIRDAEGGGKTIILDFDGDDMKAGEPLTLVIDEAFVEIGGIKYEKRQ